MKAIIAVDAMGGDYAPLEIVKGGVQAAKRYTDTEVVLTGCEETIRNCVRSLPGNLRIVNTGKSKRSSVARAAALVGNKEADAAVAFGETGKAVWAAEKYIGLLPGINMPAIAAILPGGTILLDFGAVSDCNLDNLVQFAELGITYSGEVLGNINPTLATLSIGEEPTKGNKLIRAAHERFRGDYPPNIFLGNIEGRHLLLGMANVVVTDGFTGNVAIKSLEAISPFVKAQIKSDWILKLTIIAAMPFLLRLHSKIDSSKHAAQPLLGIREGLYFIGHGNSKAASVFHGISIARKAVISKRARA